MRGDAVRFPVVDDNERRKKNLASHDLVKTGDADASDAICDSRGEVVLGFCRRCKGGEIDLEDSCIDRLVRKAIEHEKTLSPLQRTIAYARLWRAYVTAEMQFDSQDRPNGMTPEAARALYDQSPDGAILAELERRMALDPKKEPEHLAADGTVRKDHYGAGRQPWDDMVDAGWGPHFAAGNALKYVRRHASKNGADDLEKGRWYFNRLLEMSVLRPRGEYDGPLEKSEHNLAMWTYDKLMFLLTEDELRTLRG